MANLEAGMYFDIDVCALYDDGRFLKQWPNFKDDLYENPTDTLNCIKLGIYQKILKTLPEEKLKYVLNSISSLPTIKLGILNYEPTIYLRDLKLNYYEKLVSTRGCVIRVGRVKYLVQWMVFACFKCRLQKLVRQSQEIYTLPKKCDVCGTVSKFHPVLDSPGVKSIPFQIIRIQEPLNDEQENKGRVPKVLDVELMDDLVNVCMPGDDITLTGVIKIYKEPNLFALLVHSLCPSIYGHEMIKAGLILSLFGGNAKRAQSRDDIHILLVGDPGLGKSQMLQACARISTKGI
ncbi:DNA replication licensing factor MCM8 [Ooceraea biroi]|uniref:DNA replication licensing factor MCM8 n=1 Tax=Ooceraea biroi TaxID=2015173 RepID=A0A026W660_OOCBI|nr:DNA replication licensing factor MCM8 [Ooceraea biroi]